MKLITHNFLTSNIIKGVKNGYPLGILPAKVEVKDVEFNPAFITRMLPKVDWVALQKAAKECGYGEGLPDAIKDELMEDTDFLKKVHNALMEVEVIEGKLVCPESGREFPINNGVPNMLLNEDEV
ncbi:multifunctional methyltransferase subunit TRM112-like protein [Saccostrea cucullata]|uniref:multifunctional methyltransferase subunit TRM112-like protein n=1 Tax=Saccostrea cuccullata TaxID=36930 RepID=UPI002ED1B078